MVYVSKQELLELERKRVKELKAEQIFYGRTNEALTLIEQIANSYKDGKTKVLFITDGFAGGTNVGSISKAVHAAVIISLEGTKDNKQKIKRVIE